MLNYKDVLELELKNLYALEKQSEETLADLQEAFEHKKMQKLIMKWHKADAKNYDKVKKILAKLEINPGNTIDSVATEMLKNISEIAYNEQLEQSTKVAGAYASFNRLIHYKIACYDTARQLAKHLKGSPLSKKLKKSRQRLEEVSDKLDKYGKKHFLKD